MSGHTLASTSILVGLFLMFARFFFRTEVRGRGIAWPWQLARYYRTPGVILHWVGLALIVAGFFWKFTHRGV